MPDTIPIAAIDAGSNAIRMVISEITDSYNIRPVKKLRTAIRLGHDAFTIKKLSDETVDQVIQCFKEFRQAMKSSDVLHYMAVGTSALRETSNSRRVVEKILFETGIHLRVIDALEEGRLIHDAISHVINLRDRNAFLVDIGGGSVEISHSEDNTLKECESFKLGTVRLIEKMNRRGLSEKNLAELINSVPEAFTNIKRVTKRRPIDFIVGTGGNFDCLAKMRKRYLNKTSDSEFTLDELNQMISKLENCSVEERINKFDLNNNRADVIMPAAYLIKKIMEETKVEMAYIPKVGLKDGLLLELQKTLIN